MSDMSKKLCQMVLLVCLGTSAGCFGSHGGGAMDASVDGSRTDARADSAVPPDATLPPRDATPPPPRDATPPPPPPECDAVRATRACVDTGFVPPGVPFSLPIAVGGDGGCYCGEDLECDARIVGDHLLELNTLVCSRGDVCDACFPWLDGACELPPLDEGSWQVVINGDDAFELIARPIPPSIEPMARCYEASVPVPEGTFCPFPGELLPSGSEICYPAAAPAHEPMKITVTNTCAGCDDYSGGCSITVVGDAIEVRALTRSCNCPSCGACPEICQREEVSCYTPALEAGDYRVMVGGRRIDTITIGGDISVGELCGGSIP